MPCPFGFTANDADDEDDLSSEDDHVEEKGEEAKGSEDDSERMRPAPANMNTTPKVAEKKPKKKVANGIACCCDILSL